MVQVTKQLMREYASELKNWGKWGPDDEIGTLNYVTPECVAEAASLVKKGKVFSMAIPLDLNGPQTGWGGRVNPIRIMLATGTDAAAGKQGDKNAYADDLVIMATQCATHWDALGHVFYRYEDENGQMQTVMWNGYPATMVDSKGCGKCGIHNTKDKLAGRGVLLDMARYKGMDELPGGFGITPEDLDGCAKAENLEIKRGDFLLIRTGQLGKLIKAGSYGDLAKPGDAPGLEFDTLKWLHDSEIAAVAMDTWGVEVRPNRTDDFFQPWHAIIIPILGMIHGEMFKLDELAADCAEDGQYAFFLVAASLPFTGGAGTPVNPMAFK